MQLKPKPRDQMEDIPPILFLPSPGPLVQSLAFLSSPSYLAEIPPTDQWIPAVVDSAVLC